MTTLGDERGGSVTVMQSPYAKEFWDLVDVVRKSGRDKDPFVRQQLAWTYENVEIQRVAGLELKAAQTQGRSPGPGILVSKLRSTEYHKKFAQMAMAIVGPESLILDLPARATTLTSWQDIFLRTPAQTIAGGSSQIQRNIISERALGMPKEPSRLRLVALKRNSFPTRKLRHSTFVRPDSRINEPTRVDELPRQHRQRRLSGELADPLRCTRADACG